MNNIKNISNFTFLDFTKLNQAKLMMILEWRNHPDVTRGMLNEYVAEEEHFAFVQKLKKSKQKKYWLVSYDTEPIGVFNLTNITVDHAEVGLYLNPDKIGLGLGTSFLQASLEFVKHTFAFKKVWLEVFTNNDAAIHLYQKFGFKQTGKRQHPKGTLIQMGLVLKRV